MGRRQAVRQRFLVPPSGGSNPSAPIIQVLVCMQEPVSDMLFFSGTSNQVLAQEIAAELGISLGKIAIERFPDGETSVQIVECVRGRDVFVLQSIALDPNNQLMELLIIVDALKRAAARSIVAVIPYYGYCRQDRRDSSRVPITAKLVADLLQTAGVSQVIAMDLHAQQIEGFFNIPVENLYGRDVLVDALQEIKSDNLIVVTPDFGSIKLARAYAHRLGVNFAIVEKRRKTSNEVEAVTVIGDVKGKDILLADDMCSTASTLLSAAKACQGKGACRVFAAVTHGLFTEGALEAIEKSPIEKLFVSNTILQKNTVQSTKIVCVSVAKVFSHSILCILSKKSISSLFIK
jgi:ribose-phosphate pyrophosphokinase